MARGNVILLRMAVTLSFTIEDIGAGGDGIARHDGKAVFIPKTVPGDVIEAVLTGENRSGYFARMVRVISPGPQRDDAPCPHYESCGGCALQHVTPDVYRNWKITQAKNDLARAGVMPERWLEPVFVEPASRRRISIGAVNSNGHIVCGFKEPAAPTIIDIHTCLIMEPGLMKIVEGLRAGLLDLLPRSADRCEILIQQAGGQYEVVFTSETLDFNAAQRSHVAVMAERLNLARVSLRAGPRDDAVPIIKRSDLTARFGTLQVAVPPGAFLQASIQGEAAITRAVMSGLIEGLSAPDFRPARTKSGPMMIADLFAGCGTLSGPLLDRGRVHAVEYDANAVAALQAARRPHVHLGVHSGVHLTTERRDLFNAPLGFQELNKFNAVVFDPPRAGAQAQARQIARSQVPLVIGVSCNPASFARDARIMQEGGYRLRSAVMIDQFVWSAHAELVGVFYKSMPSGRRPARRA